MPTRGKYFNLDPTPDNFRAIWDQLHRMNTDLLAAQDTILRQQGTITTLQSSLDRTSKAAQQALVMAGQRSSAFGASSGGTPVSHLAIPDHLVDVQAHWTAEQPTVSTLAWGFRVTRLLAWQFRAEIVEGVPFAMGLLLSGGSNLYTCNGITYKVGRVCYPDGHIFKILTDVPTTMNPQWADDGFVDPAQYSVATDPSVAC